MQLYDYMYGRLVDANAQKDKAALEEVLEFATDFRDTWAGAMKALKEQAAAKAEARGEKAGEVSLKAPQGAQQPAQPTRQSKLVSQYTKNAAPNQSAQSVQNVGATKEVK